MANLTEDRDTKRREGTFFVFEAAERIFTGALVALDAQGKAIPATASGNRAVGVAEVGKQQGESVSARRGCFAFDNDAASPLTPADIGSECVIVDDHTVGKGDGGAIAGIMLGLDDNGVWVKI